MLTNKKDAKREMEMPLIPISREYSIDYSKIKTNIEAGRIPTPSGLLRNLEGLYFTIAHTDVKFPLLGTREWSSFETQEFRAIGVWKILLLKLMFPQCYLKTGLHPYPLSKLFLKSLTL